MFIDLLNNRQNLLFPSLIELFRGKAVCSVTLFQVMTTLISIKRKFLLHVIKWQIYIADRVIKYIESIMSWIKAEASS